MSSLTIELYYNISLSKEKKNYILLSINIGTKSDMQYPVMQITVSSLRQLLNISYYLFLSLGV